MSFTLEFHDCEVHDVVADGAFVRLRFSAAAVRDAAGGRGWLASVVLTLAQATLDGDVAHAFGKITEATLRHDGATARRVTLPGTLSGALELTLQFANGTLLAIHAHGSAGRCGATASPVAFGAYSGTGRGRAASPGGVEAR